MATAVQRKPVTLATSAAQQKEGLAKTKEAAEKAALVALGAGKFQIKKTVRGEFHWSPKTLVAAKASAAAPSKKDAAPASKKLATVAALREAVKTAKTIVVVGTFGKRGVWECELSKKEAHDFVEENLTDADTPESVEMPHKFFGKLEGSVLYFG